MDKMTDLEIERRIADIEGIHYMETRYKGNANFLALVSENDFTGTPPEMIGKYNPLEDWLVTGYLMEKHDIDNSLAGHETLNEEIPIYCAKKHNSKADLVFSKSRRKVILLAIIEAHKESNNG